MGWNLLDDVFGWEDNPTKKISAALNKAGISDIAEKAFPYVMMASGVGGLLGASGGLLGKFGGLLGKVGDLGGLIDNPIGNWTSNLRSSLFSGGGGGASQLPTGYEGLSPTVDITGTGTATFANPTTYGGIGTSGLSPAMQEALGSTAGGAGAATGAATKSGLGGLFDQILPDKWKGIVSGALDTYGTLQQLGIIKGGQPSAQEQTDEAYDEYLRAARSNAERLMDYAQQDITEAMARRGITRGSMTESAMQRSAVDIMGKFADQIGMGALQAAQLTQQGREIDEKYKYQYAQLASGERVSYAQIMAQMEIARQQGKLDLYLKELEADLGTAKAQEIKSLAEADRANLAGETSTLIDLLGSGGGYGGSYPNVEERDYTLGGDILDLFE